MLRKLALALASVVMILPGWVFALGIGDIELHSYLNQPLNAEIKLLGASQQDLDSLHVSLAEPAEFSRAGIEYPDVLRSLRMTVVRNANGMNHIKIITRDDLREPFLNFLIEVSWGKGRMLREYTLLIDPPVLASTKPVTLVEASTMAPDDSELFPRRPIDTTASEPEPVQESPDVSPTPARTTQAPSSGNYRTKRNDTAWKIANELRPDKQVSVYQAMMGLLQKNPNAFIGNNINRLKAGYILNVPDRVAMTSMSTADARVEVNRQYQVWKSGKSAIAKKKATEPTAAPVDKTPADKTGKGRLELLAPKTGDTADTGKLASASNEQVQKELALAKEASEAQSQENTELRDRISQLEEQINNANRLTTLQDTHLAELQKKLAELQGGEVTTPAEVTPATAPPAEPPKPEKAPVPAAKVAKAAAPPPAADMEAGFIDETTAYLIENPMMAGLSGAVVLILLALIIMMVRNRMAAGVGFQESILREREPLEPTPAPTLPEAEAEEREAAVDDVDLEATSSYLSDFAVSNLDAEPSEVSETDPLTEADVFLAYGRFQPAESMIKEAIDNEPDRKDLKLKLLEIYYAAKNRDSFEGEATALKETMDDSDPVWSKVVEMGQDLCPGNALFGEGGQATEEPEIPDFSDIDIPDQPIDTPESAVEEPEIPDIGDMETPAESADTAESADSDDNMLDFDLGDFEEKQESADGSAAEELATEAPEMDLDFDVENAIEEPAGETSGESVEEGISAEAEADMLAEDMANELEDLVSSMESTDTGESGTESDEPGDLDIDIPDDILADTGMEGEALNELDEVGTKLDLARAYIDMGDPEGARNILSEVIEEGNDDQKKEAEELKSQLT